MFTQRILGTHRKNQALYHDLDANSVHRAAWAAGAGPGTTCNYFLIIPKIQPPPIKGITLPRATWSRVIRNARNRPGATQVLISGITGQISAQHHLFLGHLD